MFCASCGSENREGRKFCSECAAPLAVACASCGALNQPGEKFCGECASPIGGSAVQAPASTSEPRAVPVPPSAASLGRPSPIPGAAAPGPVAPVAERRLVSILFADLVGFTPFAEERDAEEVRETLTRYFDLARDVIERYGGAVEKFIGDAVMAVWGAPVAREDDAERAVRAALELVDAVRTLGPSIQARAGVLTGEAAVTLGATNQGMVAGDLVNTASRLQGAASPGTVLVGEATVRAADRAIAFEEAGEQVLKGKTAPVPAWRAVRVVAERGGRGRSEALEAPFVGRDDELRLLKDLFHATSREGRARLVSVIGPAGIGKSRLAWEFTKYLDGLVEAVWWHDGRSPAYGDGITFWALGEMVRGRAGLRETDDERTTRTRIAAMLVEHVADETERRWIEPALLALLGIETGVRSEQLFGAWRTFFERLAASGPVVMVFEDFHYADGGLIDFVDHLLEWSRGVPIYVLTLARPELLERRGDWGAGKRNFVSVYLDPLPEPAMRQLLAGLVPGLPEPAVRAIVARADGVPLYAVETVRMLVAEGRLVLEGAVYVPTGDLAALAVPETLTALIASRLDGLPPEDRALVNDASVLGQSFTQAGLAAVSGADEAELEQRLRALVRRELLTLEVDPRSPERGQYAFVQALIREVAYNTLARRDRKVRHLAAARFFEAMGTDELAGALAGHYLAAFQNATAGEEADALAAQARIALRAAADRAGGLGSYEQALRFLVEALTVTVEPVEEAELLERAGRAASTIAHHDEAERYLHRAVEIRRAIGDRPATASAIADLGRVLLEPSRVDAALAVLDAASIEFRDLAPDPAVAAVDAQLARAFLLHGDSARAIEVSDLVLATAEPLDLAEIVADVLVTKGTALTNVGHGYEGLGAIRIALDLATERGYQSTEFRARNNLGGFLAQRDPAAALQVMRVGLEEATRLGIRSWMIFLAQNATETAVQVGAWDWSVEELERQLATELEHEDRMALLVQWVVIQASRGASVQAALAELDALATTQVDQTVVAMLSSARDWISLVEGRLEDARQSFLHAAEASPLNAPSLYPLAARAATWLRDHVAMRSDLAALDSTTAHGRAVSARRTVVEAGIAALEGRSGEAIARYRTALRAFDDLGMPWDRALTAIDMATVLDPTDPEVREAAAAAREILARLGARPFLERLEAALATGSREGPELAAEGDPSGSFAGRPLTTGTMETRA